MIKKIDRARRNSIIKNFQALAVLGCFLLPLGGKKALSTVSAAANKGQAVTVVWG